MDSLQDFFEIDEITDETPKPPVKAKPLVTTIKVPLPVRRHRFITTARIIHATPRGKAEFAAAHLAGELSVRPNKAAAYRTFGTYPKALKVALTALVGNNYSIPEKPLEIAWRCASSTDRTAFVAANADAVVTANPDAVLAAVDRATAK